LRNFTFERLHPLGVLLPQGTCDELTFFKSYFCRWQKHGKQILSVELRGQLFQNTIQSHTERMKALEREIAQLKKENEQLKKNQPQSSQLPSV